ncbi:hypothetical protein GCM10010082_10520 [Kushneria pakistanensis]|uniref:Transposase DDE domain-containing protein n=1 Tax=Kushneria pakistanensis TaxID=1508770 RepID=A0ABQ3FEG7_9GAMM|nr:hypothetical protein GCM10010082_10520 [Kushneria pakistanensis]
MMGLPRARANQLQGRPARFEVARKVAKRVRDAIDLGRPGFADKGNPERCSGAIVLDASMVIIDDGHGAIR